MTMQLPPWYRERFIAEAVRQMRTDAERCSECGVTITADNYSPCACDSHAGMCGDCAWRTLP